MIQCPVKCAKVTPLWELCLLPMHSGSGGGSFHCAFHCGGSGRLRGRVARDEVPHEGEPNSASGDAMTKEERGKKEQGEQADTK